MGQDHDPFQGLVAEDGTGDADSQQPSVYGGDRADRQEARDRLGRWWRKSTPVTWPFLELVEQIREGGGRINVAATAQAPPCRRSAGVDATWLVDLGVVGMPLANTRGDADGEGRGGVAKGG